MQYSNYLQFALNFLKHSLWWVIPVKENTHGELFPDFEEIDRSEKWKADYYLDNSDFAHLLSDEDFENFKLAVCHVLETKESLNQLDFSYSLPNHSSKRFTHYFAYQEDGFQKSVFIQCFAPQDSEIDFETNDNKEIFSSLTHELRAPLVSIQTELENADKNTTTKKGQESLLPLLDSVRNNVNQTLLLVDDIVSFSQDSRKRLSIRARPNSLRIFMQKLKSITRPLRNDSKKEVDIRFELDVVDDFVSFDNLRLRQILMNLIFNAYKFTNEGFIKLSITQDKDIFRFEVSDTGIGIDKEFQKKLFYPFESGQSEVDSEIFSSGLGLFIVQQLLLKMGSEAHVSSEVGKGSKFWFDLELPVVKLAGVVSSDSLPLIEVSRRCLVVEDSAIARDDIASKLNKLECEVEILDDFASAQKQLQTEKYDWVLLDYRVKGETANDLANWIRCEHSDGRLQKIKGVFVISANSVFEVMNSYEEMAQNGISEWFNKPLNVISLRNAMALGDCLFVKGLPYYESRVHNCDLAMDSLSALAPALKERVSDLKKTLEDGWLSVQSALANEDLNALFQLIHQLKGNAMVFMQEGIVKELNNVDYYFKHIDKYSNESLDQLLENAWFRIHYRLETMTRQSEL